MLYECTPEWIVAVAIPDDACRAQPTHTGTGDGSKVRARPVQNEAGHQPEPAGVSKIPGNSLSPRFRYRRSRRALLGLPAAVNAAAGTQPHIYHPVTTPVRHVCGEIFIVVPPPMDK